MFVLLIAWMNVSQNGVLERNGVIFNLRWKNRKKIGSQMFQNCKDLCDFDFSPTSLHAMSV